MASTREPSWLGVSAASDGHDDSYWWSNNYSTNGSVTFDLGAAKPVNGFVLDLFDMSDARSPKAYSIQVSSDNIHYTTVLSGTNPDSEGSSYKYLLPSPVTARYVRYNMLSSFGGSTLLFSDFGIGLLSQSAISATASTARAIPKKVKVRVHAVRKRHKKKATKKKHRRQPMRAHRRHRRRRHARTVGKGARVHSALQSALATVTRPLEKPLVLWGSTGAPVSDRQGLASTG